MRLNKVLWIIIVLPIVYLIYNVSIFYMHYGIKGLGSSVDIINNFILSEFLIVFLIFIYYKIKINQVLKYLDLLFVSSILLVLKINEIYISDINLNIVYLFQILVAIMLEIFIIILGRSYLLRKSIIIYILLINLIIILNIGTYYYYYYTFSTVESIVFSNINMESINGILSFKIVLYSLLFIFILNYLLYKIIKKHIKKDIDTKLFIKLFLIVLLFSNILFYLDKYTARKVISIYNNVRKHQDIQVNKIVQNSFFSYIKAFYRYKYPLNDNDMNISKVKLSKLDLMNLENLKILPVKNISLIHKQYKKIILITFESLSIDFLHFYNKKIPKDVTPYFDSLLRNYFHLNNFYTSNMPTDFGMTALLKSKLDLNIKSKSLFDYLDKNGYKTFLINGVSQYYGLMGEYYPKAFRPYTWIYKEKLQKEYGNKFSGWGFHNEILYKKALEILYKNKNEKLFIDIKTIDFHQPGTYVPNDIRQKYPNEDHIIQTLRYLDQELKKFINNINIDDKTLIIVTADHNPHPGLDFKQYALKDNFLRLAKIPLILITKNHDFKKFNNLTIKYSGQIDLLPSLLSILDIDYDKHIFGKNIFSYKNNYTLGKYKNSIFYRSDKEVFKCQLSDIFKLTNSKCDSLLKYYLLYENEWR